VSERVVTNREKLGVSVYGLYNLVMCTDAQQLVIGRNHAAITGRSGSPTLLPQESLTVRHTPLSPISHLIPDRHRSKQRWCNEHGTGGPCSHAGFKAQAHCRRVGIIEGDCHTTFGGSVSGENVHQRNNVRLSSQYTEMIFELV
jgi:hypothetical protein